MTWPPVPKTVPPKLWHYTSMAGFEAMLRSRELHLTHADDLNDPVERRLLFEAYLKAVENVDPPFRADLLRYLPGVPDKGVEDALAPFVASFSDDDDNELLWRAYTGDATGVALEVDTTKLDQIRVPGFKVSVRGVTYIDDSAETAAAELIALLRASWEASKQSPIMRGFYRQAAAVPSWLSNTAPELKPVGWERESEWRLAAWFDLGPDAYRAPEEDRDFKAAWRQRDTGKRYIASPMDPSTLFSAVVVGPLGDEEAVRRILEAQGVDVPVRPARSTKRYW